MKPAELKSAIKKLGFKSAYEFGAWYNRTNKDSGRRQVRRYLSGDTEIPYVLELAIKLQLRVNELETLYGR